MKEVALESAPDDLQSALAHRYRIQGEVGRGGMATVYLAIDLKHDRQVALKVLHPDLASVVGPERFLQEIAIAARLHHPNIVPLHDSGEAGRFLYFVMPYQDGECLRDRLLREGPLPLEESIGIIRELADGLDHAHQQGVVHRDIKPENILLSGGHAFITDFGVARAVSEAGGKGLTEPGHAVGTPAYMSPEQASGDARLDARSDVYALGCVLYEMLVGDPPFPGTTPRVVLARQIQERPPSIEIARPSVPAGVRSALKKALEKTPADRFKTAGAFASALQSPGKASSSWDSVRRLPVGWATTVGILALGFSAVGLWLLWGPRTPELDSNKVTVFPMVSLGGEFSFEDGWNVALAIGAALEHTMPLKAIDGRTWLPETIRTDANALTPDVARATSIGRLAGSYIDGVIRPGNDSVSVILRLYDVRGDTLVAQETATGARNVATLVDLGLEAVTPLLAKLIDPTRKVDLSPLTDRNTGAVALFIQGDREYRKPRFGTALEFYRRAVEEDSLLAFAAVKGAWAATWAREWTEAEKLVQVAIQNDSLLPNKYRHFAHGLQAFLLGNANQASSSLRIALEEDPGWSEALMALGETYYHLLPSEAPLDSLAEAAFRDAFEQDTTFMPPLLHLTEIQLRNGDVEQAEELLRRLRAAEADPPRVQMLSWALECVREGGAGFDWGEPVALDSDLVLNAAQSLAVGGMQPKCAKGGFRALLASGEVPRGTKWGALQGLQGLLLSEGKPQEGLALLDSALASGTRAAYSLYVFDVLAGAPFDERAREAAEAARRGAGEAYERSDPQTRWLLGAWHAHLGEIETAERILHELSAAADSSGNRRAVLHATALSAHVALARGDTAAAFQQLESLIPTAPFTDLLWLLGEPLPVERYLLAELLFETGRYADALSVATTFDHPGPIMNLPYLRKSLELRLRAAEELNSTRLINRYRERLWRLGWRAQAESEN